MAVVRYMVRDVDRATNFYTQKLGFDLAERWTSPFAIVCKDDLELWLSGPGTYAARPMPDGRVPEPGGWNRAVVVVNNLPVLVRQLKSEGVTFCSEVITGPGGSQVLAEDGEGNVIELFQPRKSA